MEMVSAEDIIAVGLMILFVGGILLPGLLHRLRGPKSSEDE